MLQVRLTTFQQYWPGPQSACSWVGQCVSMLQFAWASRYERPQKLVFRGSEYSSGASVGDQVSGWVGLFVGLMDGAKVISLTLHRVSAQQTPAPLHSSSEPLGHHLGVLPFLQESEASLQLTPQNLVFRGSTTSVGDFVGRSESIVGRAVLLGVGTAKSS